VQFFGGGGLASGKTPWEDFETRSFFLPTFLIRQNEHKTTLVIQAIDKEAQLSSMETLIFDPSVLELSKNTLTHRHNFPDALLWQKLVESCLEQLSKTTLEKVVLARQAALTFKDLLSPLALLKELQKRASSVTCFAYLPSCQAAFIGASPENLYQREARAIYSEAVAGTRPKGKTVEEDLKYQQDLLQSEKEVREFGYVKHFIQKTLGSFCETLRADTHDKILTTSSVHHLYNHFSGVLKADVGDRELLQTLHPTPAIGGHPQQEARAYLEKHEPFERGWYAAPLGWIGVQSADLIVAIRSALIKAHTAYLFSGTGIVLGSDPLKEWEELEHKIAPFTKVML
jgi:menaquinone-specific isochorismate synthase